MSTKGCCDSPCHHCPYFNNECVGCHQDTKQWEERFVGVVRRWYVGQSGICACLGNCEKCGFHLCHGCICVLSNEVQKEITLAVEAERERIRTIIKEMRTRPLSADDVEFSKGAKVFKEALLSTLTK